MAFATKNGLDKFQAVLLYVWHKFWYDGLLFRLRLKKSPSHQLFAYWAKQWADGLMISSQIHRKDLLGGIF